MWTFCLEFSLSEPALDLGTRASEPQQRDPGTQFTHEDSGLIHVVSLKNFFSAAYDALITKGTKGIDAGGIQLLRCYSHHIARYAISLTLNHEPHTYLSF